MFRTIVVPLDGSPEAEFAIPYAADEAERHNCPIVLIRVVPRPELHVVRVPHGGPAPMTYELPVTERHLVETEVTAYLHDVVRRHALPKATVVIAPVGDPWSRLDEEIRRSERPLIVVTSATSTAHRLAIEGVAPVLNVQQTFPGSDRRSQPPRDAPLSDPGIEHQITASWL